MKGYWKRPEATNEALRDGWLRTGDLANVDAERYLYIVDRKKDMIIRGGENVYSGRSRRPSTTIRPSWKPR